VPTFNHASTIINFEGTEKGGERKRWEKKKRKKGKKRKRRNRPVFIQDSCPRRAAQ